MSYTKAFRRLEAEQALVSAIQGLLREEKKELHDELRQLPKTAEARTDWAARRHLNAPCLLAAAEVLWQEGLWGSHHGMSDAPAWDQRLQEIGRLPPTCGPYIPGESIATAEEAEALKQNELQPLEAYRLMLQANVDENAGELERVEREIARVQQFHEQFYDRELSARRAEEAERARAYALRPILFDPVRESEPACFQRIRDHCRVMAEETRRLGQPVLPRRTPELAKTVQRSIAFQLNDREYFEIARAEEQDPENDHKGVTADQVRLSVLRFCRLVEWELRPARRGGARLHHHRSLCRRA